MKEHNKKEPLDVSSNVIESFQNLNEVYEKEKEPAQELLEYSWDNRDEGLVMAMIASTVHAGC